MESRELSRRLHRSRGERGSAARAGIFGMAVMVAAAGCTNENGRPTSGGDVEVSRRALAGDALRPFPQGGGFPGCPTCIKPNVTQSTMNADVKSYYTTW